MSDVLTARLAAQVVMRSRWSHGKIVVDEFAPDGWGKGDVMEVSAAGYLTEYEVKLSRNDFARDRRKLLVLRDDIWVPKHQLLRERDVRGPNRFFFCAPYGLLNPDAIPEWAGLCELLRGNDGHYRPFVRKDAPLLHTCKVPRAVEECALRAAQSRFHGLLGVTP
jgi:hypothetical protein